MHPNACFYKDAGSSVCINMLMNRQMKQQTSLAEVINIFNINILYFHSLSQYSACSIFLHININSMSFRYTKTFEGRI